MKDGIPGTQSIDEWLIDQVISLFFFKSDFLFFEKKNYRSLKEVPLVAMVGALDLTVIQK